MKLLLKLLLVFLPWPIRRRLLISVFKYKIHPTARIGFSFFYPVRLEMGPEATVGHLNVAVNLEKIVMHEKTTINRGNWITGYPLKLKGNFQHIKDRKPYLIMGKDSAITKNHLIDCTDTVTIGELTSVAGYGTQILTHSTSFHYNSQHCAPITIGSRSFVGTRSILLPGTALPDSSVLGAGSVLTKAFSEPFSLYGGVAAKFIKKLDPSMAFLTRTERPR
jgi:carbonic anhydrase/acetyltransferase-like protein (isoleucine patch superfamily)